MIDDVSSSLWFIVCIGFLLVNDQIFRVESKAVVEKMSL